LSNLKSKTFAMLTRSRAHEADSDGSELFRDPGFLAHFEDAKARSALLTGLIRTRRDKGITQRVVASSMDTTQSAISQLEGGETDPRLSTLQRYARAVGANLLIYLRVHPGIADDPTQWPTLASHKIVLPNYAAESGTLRPGELYRYLSEAGSLDEESASELKVN
jgi:transcriptional regulator with XRE-family HTH domain